MNEDFLQFVWRTLSFRHTHLKTRDRQMLKILDPGIQNTDQGPDFLDARLRIGAHEWCGHVEVHIHGDEWFRHGHHRDPMYNTTILHVVFEKGKLPAVRLDGTKVPEVWIGTLLDAGVRQRYDALRKNMGDIPCQSLLGTVPPEFVKPWLEKLARDRLFVKSEDIRVRLKESKWDWGQIYFEQLGAYFGGNLNAESFRSIIRQIPFVRIRRHHERKELIEALLLGTAGYLSRKVLLHPYEQMLREEWNYLQSLYKIEVLQDIPLKYMRMRPSAFPEIRLAQLSDFLHRYPEPGMFLEPEAWQKLLSHPLSASAYFTDHVRFAQVSDSPRLKSTGPEFLRLLIINVLLPFTHAMQWEHGHKQLKDDVWFFYHSLIPEQNRITRLFHQSGVEAEDACEAQGIIHLYKNYCLKKRCLDCAIGKYLMTGGRISVQDI